MNLSKLFDMQRELDAKIIKEKGLENMDRLPNLILALQVELGECANEWRGFKYWSKDQEPRREVKKKLGYTHETKQGEDGSLHLDRVYDYEVTNPLLEEYVDALHFILAIGVVANYEEDDMGYVHAGNILVYKNPEGITHQFKDIYKFIAQFDDYHDDFEIYQDILMAFISLGEMLGFTWDQIEQAYMDKNAVNHDRQANGY